MTETRYKAAIVGIGHTGCSKDAGVEPAVLWMRACKAAIEDSGIAKSDIDGISTNFPDTIPDRVLPTPFYLTESLGLPGLRWHGAPLGGSYGPGAVHAAALAVASGQCTTALAVHYMERPKVQTGDPYLYKASPWVGGIRAHLAPYGYTVFFQYMAAWQQRFQHQFGVTREQIGQMVVDQRLNALRNPRAVMQTPLTLDEYMEARWLAEPMCLYDADMPVDAAVAVIVTTAERAADLQQPPVYVAHVSTFLGPQPDFVFHHDYTELFPAIYAKEFWTAAGLGPTDMSFAQLHDGFSIYVLLWLESLGFVERGGSGEFVGARGLSMDGSLPTNTHGGNLSEGRLQSTGHIVEAVLQLRGAAGDRQVPNATAGVVTAGGTPTVSASVLHR